MTNNFVDYAFRAADIPTMCPGTIPCERTMPDRLTDIKNVRDFGAVGDGMTDDLTAIMAAFNWQTSSGNRSTIFFPPGTYYVSAPIDLTAGMGVVTIVQLTGVLGGSTITGSFADYIIKLENDTAVGGHVFVDSLTIINNDANGGGLRVGSCVGASIRDCTVVANRGINTSTVDSGLAGAGPLEYSIENCQVSPGSNTSGSIGFMIVTDGPVLNCRATGCEIGVVTWGQASAKYFAGCHFEGCEIGIKPGYDPTGATIGDTGFTFTGCSFKNNGVAIYLSTFGGGGRISGCHIEADETVTVYGARPQYGMQILGTSNFFAGIVVEGQYDQYAISLTTATGTAYPRSQFFGVNAFNTSTHTPPGTWLMPTTEQTANFYACNCPAPVYTVANLPAFPRGINSSSWSGGTTTLTIADNISQYTVYQITVTGVSPAGYNGTFSSITIIDSATLSYPQSNPGSPTGSTGTAIFNLATNNGPGAQEGDSYNVSDSNTSTWAAAAGGGGSTHALVRWSGSNWNVIGK